MWSGSLGWFICFVSISSWSNIYSPGYTPFTILLHRPIIIIMVATSTVVGSVSGGDVFIANLKGTVLIPVQMRIVALSDIWH